MQTIEMKKWMLLFFSRLRPDGVHYIGGADPLPKPLTPEEELELVARLPEDDGSVRSVLIERNLRLVVFIAKKFENTSVGIEDLISIGTIGLIKAVNTFRPDKGIRLATYASRCIENEILMFFRSRKKLQGEVSLSDAIEGDGDGDELHLADVVGEEDTMLTDLQDRDDRILIRQLVAKVLDEREADVIRRRYGLGGAEPETQREIAKRYGISRSYVSRIEKKALEKLAEGLEGKM